MMMNALDEKIVIPALAGIIGAVIGVFSTHILHYIDRKSEERKIINESIHYLIEVFFLVNRLNTEKIIDAYLDYYFQEVRKNILVVDDKFILSAKEQYYPQLKNVIVPLSQRDSFEKLKNLGDGYKLMLAKLSTVLPIDAYYLRGKNDIELLLRLLSEYFQGVQFTDAADDEMTKKFIDQMQSSLTTRAIEEYVTDLRKELLILLKKTDCYNRKKGKNAINSIETTMLTEEEKHSVNEIVKTLFAQIAKNIQK